MQPSVTISITTRKPVIIISKVGARDAPDESTDEPEPPGHRSDMMTQLLEPPWPGSVPLIVIGRNRRGNWVARELGAPLAAFLSTAPKL